MNTRAIKAAVRAARDANHAAISCKRLGDTWRARMHKASVASCMRAARQLASD